MKIQHFDFTRMCFSSRQKLARARRECLWLIIHLSLSIILGMYEAWQITDNSALTGGSGSSCGPRSRSRNSRGQRPEPREPEPRRQNRAQGWIFCHFDVNPSDNTIINGQYWPNTCPPNLNDVFWNTQKVRVIFFSSGQVIGSGDMCPQIKSIWFLGVLHLKSWWTLGHIFKKHHFGSADMCSGGVSRGPLTIHESTMGSISRLNT